MSPVTDVIARDLRHEIESIIERRLDEHATAPKTWIVHEFVDAHSRLEGADAGLAIYCIIAHANALVLKVLSDRKRHDDEDASPQLVLPGYERIQRSYAIARVNEDGELEQTVVPVEMMTDDEIDDKADELERLAAGALAHAKELRDYRDGRRQASNRAG